MAEDARAQFVPGLRVTADHLTHVQDRFREAVLDLRRTIGLSKIAWGLRVDMDTDHLTISPGLAFSPSGLRLALNAPLVLPVDDGEAPLRVLLHAVNHDRANLRVGTTQTLILLDTEASVEPDDESDVDSDTLVIATLTPAEGGGLNVVQEEDLRVAYGAHTHSGQLVQDADGNWHFDGAALHIDAGQGPVGPAGPRGAPGDPGPEGPVGPAGEQGEQGDPGEPGPTGETGEPGPAGALGPVGPMGADGPAGPQGVPGDKGVAGAPGETGPQGNPGKDGAQGVQGFTGQSGAPGKDGLPGKDGKDGAQGPTGIQGTQGAPGKDGAPGAPGGQGIPGKDGAPGIPGRDGSQGTPGLQGIPGKDGALGGQGIPGKDGSPGLQGLQGAQGVPGKDGNPGIPGRDGAQGPKGDIGLQGVQGIQGPQGPQGLPGSGVDLDWGVINKPNWPHDGTMSASAAITLLSALKCGFTKSLHTDLQANPPHAVQVYFEPTTGSQGPYAPLPGGPTLVATLDGVIKLTAQTMTWTTTHKSDTLLTALRNGGRILIRIHTGALYDQKMRPYSSTLELILGLDTLRLPGGVFESWFFAVPG